MSLLEFVKESNRIEGIVREPFLRELEELERMLAAPALTVNRLCSFVSVYQPNARLRKEVGLNVRIGDHVAPPGGPGIREALESLLDRVNANRGASTGVCGAYAMHHAYETLHPFTDCNGRSGRAVWLWQMRGYAPLGFLHHWYYQSLQMTRQEAL